MSDPLRSPRRTRSRRAVIIGGGFAGVLAAAACRAFVDEVTIVERDVLPNGPLPRKGLPQARHLHALWSGGANAVESLVPGVTGKLLAAGARRVPLPTGMVSLSPGGWYRRWPESHYLIACSRDLLDWAIRDLVLRQSHVTVVESAEPVGLIGDARRIDGVRIRLEDGSEQQLAADLVVDASGRSSRGPQWLKDLGVSPVRELAVDAGVAYASRVYRAPAGSEDSPLFIIQPDSRLPGPGQSAGIMPIEDQRWLVSLSGTRGGEPTDDESTYLDFAKGVRHPLVGELIADAEPLSEITVTRSTVNRRRLYERCRHTPEGYVAIGDAVAALNPVYGQGMSVAALGAVALRGELRRAGVTAPGLARRAQRAIARPTQVAWGLATGQDIFYPGARGRLPNAADRLLSRYVNRLVKTSTGSYSMAKALTDVMTLQSGFDRLVRPDVLIGAVRGPLRPRLSKPPLTRRELGFLRPGGSGASGPDARDGVRRDSGRTEP
ncbi:FAD-dependent oxidoreductase [Streptomyces albipurpureus]|uniref:FAD-dependent oxidoreductase n=1 Tax=Streptomyces albipurpureus TaxID=2897419 RepID=A0ABT0UEX6_9ACTN|nr:FAD-dependent oxidoreductase [Streptomyces sp. CWNU-1]MCM2386910.1 FAD-dependent oxidoreductase [Streptomyces sp. CWNU-1]